MRTSRLFRPRPGRMQRAREHAAYLQDLCEERKQRDQRRELESRLTEGKIKAADLNEQELKVLYSSEHYREYRRERKLAWLDLLMLAGGLAVVPLTVIGSCT